MSEHRRDPDRRGLVLAVAGCVAAAAVLLLAAGQPWLSVSLPAQPPLPADSQSLTGQEVVGALVPIGVVVGAAGLALIATRRSGRLLIGAMILLCGLLAVGAIGLFLADGGITAAADWARDQPAALGDLPVPDRALVWPAVVLALVGTLLASVVGGYGLRRSGRWPVMGARYERRTVSAVAGSAAAPTGPGRVAPSDASPAASEAAMWTALERGEDPTAEPSRSRAEQGAQPTRDQPGPGS